MSLQRGNSRGGPGVYGPNVVTTFDQGSQRALESLRPAPQAAKHAGGGTLIQPASFLKCASVAPHVKPDGSRWGSVVMDRNVTGPPGPKWLSDARLRADKTTASNAPSAAEAEAVLRNPAQASGGGGGSGFPYGGTAGTRMSAAGMSGAGSCGAGLSGGSLRESHLCEPSEYDQEDDEEGYAGASEHSKLVGGAMLDPEAAEDGWVQYCRNGMEL